MAFEMRHAVTDAPDGIDAVVAPESHADAWTLKASHEMFWCSTQAGGCGTELRMYPGVVNVPHFRHLDISACDLRDSGRDTGGAYAHLGYQRDLQAWVVAQGHTARIEHTFADKGGRADLHVHVDGTEQSIEVQLTPISTGEWTERTERYSQHVSKVTWLHGPASNGTREVDRLRGDYSLTIDTQEDRVRIGTFWQDEPAWSDLTLCTIGPHGIWTPDIATALAAADVREARRRADLAAEQARREAELEAARTRAVAGARWAEERRAAAAAERADREDGAPDQDGWAWRPVPMVGERSVALLQRIHPEMAGWAAGQGWAWLDPFGPELRVAGQYMAYTARVLYWQAFLDDLRNPDVSAADTEAMTEALVATGMLVLDPTSSLGRWTRADI